MRSTFNETGSKIKMILQANARAKYQDFSVIYTSSHCIAWLDQL